VYQAGTLSGNPLATAAGLAVLDLLDDQAYDTLRERAATLAAHLRNGLDKAGIVADVPVVSTIVGLHMGTGDSTDEKAYAEVCHRLLDKGVAIPPVAYEVLV